MIIYNKIKKNKRHLLCLVLAAVSKMGVAGLFFVEPGVKVDGKYSQDVLLLQQMLPAIRHVAGDNYGDMKISIIMSPYLQNGATQDTVSIIC